MPTRSACPGRGRVSGALRARPPARRRRPGRPTSPSPTWATRCCRSRSRPGRPCVSPCRTPPRIVDLVLLELHPGARGRSRAGAGPAPSATSSVVIRDVRRQPLEDGDQGGAVGLPGSEPAQHARQSFMQRTRVPDRSGRSPRLRPAASAPHEQADQRARRSMNGPNGKPLRSTIRSTEQQRRRCTPPSRKPA